MSKQWPNPWNKGDPVKFSPVLRRYSLDYPWDQVSKDTMTLLQNGRLNMTCPHCKKESAAGPWCYKCGRMVTPDNWTVGKSVGVDGKRRRGRPTKAELAEAIKVCSIC